MYHSLIFGVKQGDTSVVYNTWDDLHLISRSRPVINPPEPVTSYIEIPGSDTVIDYTETLSGLHFKPRTGSWSFYVENGYGDWQQRYSELLKLFHGKKVRVVMEDDPTFFYDGRLTINSWNSEKDWSIVEIGYTLGVYKEPTYAGSTEELDWLWNDLFDNIIYYGTFKVSDSKLRTIINPSALPLTAKIACSSAMKVTYMATGEVVEIPATSSGSLNIPVGNSVMKFEGNGRVSIDYRIGASL